MFASKQLAAMSDRLEVIAGKDSDFPVWQSPIEVIVSENTTYFSLWKTYFSGVNWATFESFVSAEEPPLKVGDRINIRQLELRFFTWQRQSVQSGAVPANGAKVLTINDDMTYFSLWKAYFHNTPWALFESFVSTQSSPLKVGEKIDLILLSEKYNLWKQESGRASELNGESSVDLASPVVRPSTPSPLPQRVYGIDQGPQLPPVFDSDWWNEISTNASHFDHKPQVPPKGEDDWWSGPNEIYSTPSLMIPSTSDVVAGSQSSANDTSLSTLDETSINWDLVEMPPHVEDFVTKYSDAAIDSSRRSQQLRAGRGGRVPAAIVMAQAMAESAYGASELAKDAHNFFGIKCNGWHGQQYYKKDDDYHNGELVESCFRSYASASASFLDHIDFLIDGGRYQFLFSIPHTDYKAWAHGLQSAGYATSETYGARLISIIERYELHKLDL